MTFQKQSFSFKNSKQEKLHQDSKNWITLFFKPIKKRRKKKRRKRVPMTASRQKKQNLSSDKKKTWSKCFKAAILLLSSQQQTQKREKKIKEFLTRNLKLLLIPLKKKRKKVGFRLGKFFLKSRIWLLRRIFVLFARRSRLRRVLYQAVTMSFMKDVYRSGYKGSFSVHCVKEEQID